MKKLYAFFVLLLVSIIQIKAQLTPDANKIIYVDSSIATSGNGSSWTQAVKSLADALKYARTNAATWAGTNDSLRIYVAKGTYIPSYDASNSLYTTDGARRNSFVMVKNVQLYGGFPSGGSTFTARNWSTNPTILSGDRGVLNDNTDNCYTVVVSCGAVGKALLDGFTITKGNANQSGVSVSVASTSFNLGQSGAGMKNYFSAIELKNMIITNNTTIGDGAGLYNIQSASKLTNVTISNNTATSYGGGMCNNSNCPLVLTNVIITSNTSSNGGGMANWNLGSSAPPTLTNVTISNNTATNYGGGMYNSSSSPTLTNVTISNNTATNNGGGMYNSSSSPTLESVSITGNTSNNGGGMYNSSSSSPTLKSVSITGNTSNYGGGMSNSSSSPTLTNVSITGNTANINGGGMRNVSSSPVITNTTIANNKATTGLGGGIFNVTNSSPNFRNTIIYGNTASTGANIYLSGANTPNYQYTLIGEAAWNPTWGTDGGNNLFSTIDPFVNSAGANYNLKPCALPVNAGSNALYTGAIATDKDLGGNPRLSALIIDMGAYEQSMAVPDADKIIYVDASVATSGNGSSWTQAVKNLADALLFARDNASLYAGASDSLRIYVAQGTYIPLYTAADGAACNMDGARDNAFVMVKNVQLYGGFPSGGSAFAARDWNANPTILSGDRGVLSDNADNCHHVVISAGAVDKALLNGFTVTKGNADGAGAVVINTQSLDRNDGGGISNIASSPFIKNVKITDNSSSDIGGGLFNYTSSNPKVEQVVISNNTAINHAGGMFNYQSSPILIDVVITNNAVSGATATGGGVRNTSSNPVFTNVTISSNSAFNGAGMYNSSSSPILTNVTITNNTAINDAGGMFNYTSPAVLTNVKISGNTATFGGGVYNRNDTPKFINVSITNNTATNNGGGIFNYTSSPVITNTTIANNKATTSGGGVYNRTTSNPTFNNTIIFGNTAPTGANIYLNGANTPNYQYTLIGEAAWNPAWGTDGGNNLFSTVDPFVNSAGANYNLKPCALPVNAGSNALYTGVIATDKDLGGNPRLSALTIDMGAYEQLMATPDADKIIYVDASIATSGNGSSWTQAVKNLADALQFARINATTWSGASDSLRIYVAQGTYLPLYMAADGAACNTDGARDNAFVMVKNVQLYGGFPSGGSAFAARDWNANPTILSGDRGVLNDNTDNCHHVVISAGAVDKALLNGFTVTKGSADKAGSIIISTYNIGRGNGGGIYSIYSSPTLTNVTISNNTVTNYGGGMSNFSSSPTLTNVTISNNTATNSGGGMFNNSSSSPILTNVTISNNTATTNGGGMHNFSSSSPTLTNVSISNNRSNYGGGMLNQTSSSPTLTNVRITGNTANINGGGMRNASSSPVLINTTIANNKATTQEGGGIYNVTNASPQFKNTIIYGNTASTGANIHLNGANTPSYQYTLIGDTAWNAAWGTDGGNNLFSTIDPFVNSAGGDYTLKPCALPVNAGSNALYTGTITADKDLGNVNPRLFDATIDMGAYENQTEKAQTASFVTVFPTVNVCPGNKITYTTQTGKSNYSWQFSGTAGTDYTLVSGGGTASNQAVVLWNGTALGTEVMVSYGNTPGCAVTPVTKTTLPTKGATLAANGNARTCYVGTNETVLFYHTASPYGYITSVTSGATALGDTKATVYVEATTPEITACTMSSLQTAAMQRHWVITPTVNSGATVRLPYTSTEYTNLKTKAGTSSNPNDNPASQVDVKLTKYSNTGSPATENNTFTDNCGTGGVISIYGSATTGTANPVPLVTSYYSDFAIPSFSEFWLHGESTNSPLPIELTNFSANCEENGTRLSWETATETNVNHFDVLRSRNGETWENIATVNAVGNSSISNTYQAFDNTSSDMFYYRLRSVDNDGTSETFSPIAVQCDIIKNIWSVYPVPTKSNATISITSNETYETRLLVVNMEGRLVQEQSITVNAGSNIISIDVRHLENGAYVLLIENNKELKPLKLMKID